MMRHHVRPPGQGVHVRDLAEDSHLVLHRLATQAPGAILVDARKREPGQFTRISSMILHELPLKLRGATDMQFV